MNYSAKEVRALIEGYAELRESKEVNGAGLRTLLKLADLDRALKTLSPREYHAVLIYGLIGDSSRAAGEMLGVSHITVQNRYEAGVSQIVQYLNYGAIT